MKTYIYSGMFAESCKAIPGKAIEDIVEKVLLANGYPVVGNTCNQPTLTGAAVCAENGLSGTGVAGDCVVLGGTLLSATDIDTDTFDFSVTKDNVKLDINDSGGSMGTGEVARFIGVNGTLTAETGVFTNGGGAPSIASRTFDSGSNLYTLVQHNTTLNQLILECGDTDNAYNSFVLLREDEASIGLDEGTLTRVLVARDPYTGSDYVIKLEGLFTFADNIAAAAAGLPLNSIYKTAAGALMIRV